jgi:hypothetical protein
VGAVRGAAVIITAEYLERLIEQSRWLPVGLVRVYIEPGIVIELNRTDRGWIVSVRRHPEELPASGTRNFTAPGDVPDYLVSQKEE